MIVSLPYPDKALWSNSRAHWSVKYRQGKWAQQKAWFEATQAAKGRPKNNPFIPLTHVVASEPNIC
jgi:hypothetical protein